MLERQHQHEEATLVEHWRLLVRRRWAIYLSTVAAVLVTLVNSFLTTPEYRATATLQIERRNPEILTFRDLSQMDYSFTAYSDFYQTQYKILGSEPVARRAAERLALDVHPDIAPNSGRPGLLSRLRALVPSRSEAAPRSAMDRASDTVLGRLEITPVRNSHLVKVSWTSSAPQLAADVANGIADAYVELNLESQFSTSGQAEEFLGNQIGELKREIAELEGKLQDYGESRRIVSIDGQTNLTLQALQDIGARRTAAQTDLARAEATWRAATEAPADGLPEVSQSPLIAQLRQQCAVLETELGEKSRKFGDEWPGIQILGAKLQQARAGLAEETERIATQVRAAARAEHVRARTELQNLDRLLADQEGAAQQLKRESVEYANLQSDVDKKRETLNALITRQNEVSVATRLKDLHATSSNIRILERAQPPAHAFKPNVRFGLAVALFLGLGVGIGIVLALDRLDNTVSSIDDLQRASAWPLLAVIPHHDGAPAGPTALLRMRRRSQDAADNTVDLVAHRVGRGGAAEGYRDLRTAILLSSPGQAPRTLMVTSALPEEGKSATAINLAVVLAQTGARVLLVDTDLRRPRLHRAFGVRNRSGVTSFLSGMERDPLGSIVRTEIEGLDLLASGPVPPNPSELLNSPQFRELSSRLLESGYQHVVFDSPPVLSVSDPVIVATSMDCCVLVVRADRTPRPSVRVAMDKLGPACAGTAGIVLNDLDRNRWGRGYYGGAYYDADELGQAALTRATDESHARPTRRGA